MATPCRPARNDPGRATSASGPIRTSALLTPEQPARAAISGAFARTAEGGGTPALAPRTTNVVALERAMLECATVVVVLRGDPAQGRAVRTIKGRPTAFRPSRDGRLCVVLEIGAGTAEQIVLLDRVAQVIPQGSGRDPYER